MTTLGFKPPESSSFSDANYQAVPERILSPATQETAHRWTLRPLLGFVRAHANDVCLLRTCISKEFASTEVRSREADSERASARCFAR